MERVGFPVSNNNSRIVYEMLWQLPPFRKWKLPPSDKVVFQTLNTNDCYGEFEPPNIIRISRKRIGFFDTYLKTMAHEMVHLYMYVIKHKGWSKHDGRFAQLANKVSEVYGFDPKEF